MTRRKYRFADRAEAETQCAKAEKRSIATYQMLCHLTGQAPHCSWHSDQLEATAGYCTASATVLRGPHGPCAMLVKLGDCSPDIVADPWQWCHNQTDYLRRAPLHDEHMALSQLVNQVREVLQSQLATV